MIFVFFIVFFFIIVVLVKSGSLFINPSELEKPIQREELDEMVEFIRTLNPKSISGVIKTYAQLKGASKVRAQSILQYCIDLKKITIK